MNELLKKPVNTLTSGVNRFITDHPEHIPHTLNVLESIFYNTITVEDPHFNLQKAQTHLETDSLILSVVPHTTNLDPFLVSLFVRHYVTNKPFAWISSAKFHRDLVEQFSLPDMGALVEGSEALETHFDMKRFPVFQPYLYHNDSPQAIPQELHAQAKGLSLVSLRNARKFLTQQPSVLAVSFEGTRSKKGGFLPAEPAVNMLGKPSKDRSISILPILLKGAHEMQDPQNPGLHKLNPFVPVTITVGTMLSYEAAQEIANHYQWANGQPLTVADAVLLYSTTLGPSIIKPDTHPFGAYAPEHVSVRS